MKRSAIVLAVGVALVVLAGLLFRGGDDPATQARAAYQRGDYATAVREYQRAAPECADVGALAVNQAAALYRLEHYDAADSRYQFAGSNGDDLRAAQAAYGRGNCALHQGCKSDGTLDKDLLEQAAQQYRACLECESSIPKAAALFADARHNLEMTKLLQAPPPSRDQVKDEEPDKSDPEQLAQKDSKGGDPEEQSGDSGQQGQTLASLFDQKKLDDYLCPDCRKQLKQTGSLPTPNSAKSDSAQTNGQNPQQPQPTDAKQEAKTGNQSKPHDVPQVDAKNLPKPNATKANPNGEQKPSNAKPQTAKLDQPPKSAVQAPQGQPKDGEWKDQPKQQQGKGPT